MKSFNERNYGKQFLIKTFHEMIYETYFSKFNKLVNFSKFNKWAHLSKSNLWVNFKESKILKKSARTPVPMLLPQYRGNNYQSKIETKKTIRKLT